MIFSFTIDEVVYTVSSLTSPPYTSSNYFSLEENSIIQDLINETDLTLEGVRERLRLFPELSACVVPFSCSQFIDSQISLIKEGYQIDIDSLRELLEDADNTNFCYLIKRLTN